jgi:hypothetical protein
MNIAPGLIGSAEIKRCSAKNRLAFRSFGAWFDHIESAGGQRSRQQQITG